MSILRGYTVQSITAFRLATGACLIYTVSIYAPLIGAYQFYIR